MSKPQYPDPEQLDHLDDDTSADQRYYVGWLVQHNRLWLLVFGLALACMGLIVNAATMAAHFKPTIQYVTLDGGYPVVWNDRGNIVIDNNEYVPARMRAVVQTFIENRYAYDWQDIAKINTALRLMPADARAVEYRKFQDIDPATHIVATRLTARLQFDLSRWTVVAQGGGRFKVSVSGNASLNDAVRYPDPKKPLVTPFVFTLTLQTVPATDTNPLGFVVVETGKDIL